MDIAAFDRRPIIVAIAGPNGAGKTTFYRLIAKFDHGQPEILARRLPAWIRPIVG
jgi:uridine kinase